MNLRSPLVRATLVLGLMTWPALALAVSQDIDSEMKANDISDNDGTMTMEQARDPQANVARYDLGGPRAGVTITPDGRTRSQFGWHFENQVEAAKNGPWFIVERVLLVGGVEEQRFIPSGTLVFGLRLPSGFELGVGPSVTFGGYPGARTAIVAAVGQTFRFGSINVPVNLAVASEKTGARFSIVTGWAIRDRSGTTL